MKSEDFNKNDDSELRKKAEDILQGKRSRQLKKLDIMSIEEIRGILHELQVHQIELEIQNEELRQTQSELETLRAIYYDLYDLAPVGYCSLSQKGLILKANLAASSLLRTDRGTLIKNPFSHYIHSEDQDKYYFFRKDLIESSEPQECEIRMKGSNETVFWVWLHATTVQATDGSSVMRIVIIDITDRKQAEKELEQREKRQRLAVEIAFDFLKKPLSQMDSTIDNTLAKIAKIMDVDRSYIFESSEDDPSMSCKHNWCASDQLPGIDNNQNKSFVVSSWIRDQILKEKTVSITNIDDLPGKAINEKKKFKSESIKSVLLAPMIIEEDVIGFIGVDCVNFEKKWNDDDILTFKLVASIVASAVKRSRTEKDLIYHTFHDQLTGLFNRTYFKEESRRLNVERQLPISIIIADVNGLKLINDTYGHNKGDKLLKKVASIFQETCREEDIITRWGGDEFLILLPQMKEDETKRVCDRIRKKCSKTKKIKIPVSIALGYAIKERVDEDIYACIDEADEKMYKNKLTESRSVKGNVLKALLKILKLIKKPPPN